MADDPIPPRGARWREITLRLKDEVIAGLYSGSRLPTEPELASRFGVNRHTVRRAIATLVGEGLLTVNQGRGTFVAGEQIDYLLGRRTRFSANLRRAGREGGHQLLGARSGRADHATAEDLGLEEGAEVILLETLGRAEGVGLSYAFHAFPAARFATLPEALARKGTITGALAECGVADYTRRVSRMLARPPSVEEARHLGQPQSRPILQVIAVNVDEAGTPIERCVTVFAGDRVQIVVENDVRDG